MGLLDDIKKFTKKIPGMKDTLEAGKSILDTIDWSDVTDILTDTAAINWTNVTDILTDTAGLVTDMVTTLANLSTIITNTTDVAGVKSVADSISSVQSWADVTSILGYVDDINWGDITGVGSIMSYVSTIDWSDVTSILTNVNTLITNVSSLAASWVLSFLDEIGNQLNLKYDNTWWTNHRGKFVSHLTTGLVNFGGLFWEDF